MFPIRNFSGLAILLLMLTLNSCCLLAQLANTILPAENPVNIEKEPITLYYENDTLLVGNKFSCSGKVIDIAVDRITGNVFFITKFFGSQGYKEMALFDVASEKKIWQNRSFCEKAEFAGDKLLVSDVNTSGENIVFILDTKSGSPLTSRKGLVLVHYDSLNLFIAFPKFRPIRKIEIIDEEQIFKSITIPIRYEYDYSGLFTHTDFKFLFLNGLVTLDSNYVELWRRNFNTRQVSITKTAGIFSNFFYPNINLPKPLAVNFSSNIAGLHSNLLIHNDTLLFCDKDSIYSLNLSTGDTYWQRGLIHESASSKILEYNDSSLVIINTALGVRSNYLFPTGVPYISIQNTSNGDLAVQHTYENSSYILSYQKRKDSIYILLNNGISIINHNFENSEYLYPEEITGDLYFFLDEADTSIYCLDTLNKSWVPASELKSFPNQITIFSTRGLVYLNTDLSIEKIVDISLLALKEMSTAESIFLTKFFSRGKSIFQGDLYLYQYASGETINLTNNKPRQFIGKSLYIFNREAIEIFELD